MIQALPKLIFAGEFLLAAAIHKHSWENYPIQRDKYFPLQVFFLSKFASLMSG